MLRMKVVGLKELEKSLDRAVAKFPDQMKRNLRKALYVVKKRVDYYLTGRRGRYAGLNEQTGKLRRSIYAKIDESAGRVEGRIGTKVPYAKFWELEEGQFASGHIRHIRPTKAKALRFTVNGRVVYSQHVQQEGPRPFLRVALKDEVEQVVNILGRTGEESLN